MKTLDLFTSSFFCNSDKPLNIGLQKSGRLYEQSIEFFRQNDIDIAYTKNGYYQSQNANIRFYFLREKDIPHLIEKEKLDFGIVGLNTYTENKKGYLECNLGFSRCRMVIAVPDDSTIQSVKDLQNGTITTSYPNTINAYLKQNNVCNVQTEKFDGSIETISNLCGNDAIFDIVETGNSLRENNFRELKTVLISEAILISSATAHSRIDKVQRTKILDRYQLV